MKTIFQRDKIAEPALFTPVDTTKKIENFPEICVSTFSEKNIQKFSSLKDVEKIAELYTANGAMPVYKMRQLREKGRAERIFRDKCDFYTILIK